MKLELEERIKNYKSISKQFTVDLEYFNSTLPYFPFATDDYQYGIFNNKPKEKVLKKKYLQHNPTAIAYWIVIDCDYTNAMEKLLDNPQLPQPNFVCISPKSGNSHFYYAVDPVKLIYTTGNQSQFMKCLNLLAKIEVALQQLLKGDGCYVGLMSKNPLCDYWYTYQLRKERWSLEELKEYVSLPKKLTKRQLENGFGRNVSLFENTRHVAYAEVESFRANKKTLEEFTAYMEDYISIVNQTSFENHLPYAEVKSIAKSIAKWTYEKYKVSYRMPDGAIVDWNEYVKSTHTSKQQSERSKKRKVKKGREPIGEPWIALGISRTKYFRNKSNKKY